MNRNPHPPLLRSAFGIALAASLAACAVGPAYEQPPVMASLAWKEATTAPGWVPAAPADTQDRGAWWEVFGDAQLDALAQKAEASNQNIAAAVATYAQAQAAVREQRAALFPSLGLTVSSRRGGTRGAGNASSASSGALGADWAPDLWGRLRATVSSAQAQAQASEADLASARLSAIGDLVLNYFSLRETDAELATLAQTIEGYDRSLTIARNRYAAGIAAHTDLLQAETTLANARVDYAALQRTRAGYEHAIAVLTGVPPADLRIEPEANWQPVLPEVPLAVPSQLLQRRPDIAAAERAVAAANAQIGIARSAYFPSLSLNGSLGRTGASLSDLFDKSDVVWSLGLSIAQVLFDAGAIGARVDQTVAARDAAIARYRQTTLAAFQSVEDQLSALASLAQQEAQRRAASAAADKTEEQIMNRYRAGQLDYTSVVVAQTSALSARRSVLQLQVARQNAAVGLIQAMGGGWQAEWMRDAPPAPADADAQANIDTDTNADTHADRPAEPQ